MQFLAHSMDKLASAFQPHQFKHLKEHVCGIGKWKFILEPDTEKRSTPKRKLKRSTCKRKNVKQSRCDFIDDKTSVDGSSDEVEASDSLHADFIDDENCGDGSSFYHRIDSLIDDDTSCGEHEDEADKEKIGLLCRKGVFCYGYFNCSDRLNELALLQQSLPV